MWREALAIVACGVYHSYGRTKKYRRPLEKLMTQQSATRSSALKNGPDQQSLRRVGAASLIGTTIEYYDFFVYGTAAALVFPAVFFPSSSPAIGTIASFATFGVAFFARPVGSILFGHFGDRIGRKRTLVWTLLI